MAPASAPSTPYWQLALDREGEAVTGLDEIAQSIFLILQTPLGSLPGQPELGCEAFTQLDRPFNTAVPKMIQAVFRALRRWEPRIDVLRVGATPVKDGAVILSVVWAPKGSSEEIGQFLLLGAA